MDAATAERPDEGIVRMFNMDGVNEFERIGFLEVMKARLEQVWIQRYYDAMEARGDKS